MGNTESTNEEYDEFARFEGVDTLGYRVLGVQPNSPASQAGLVSFFDFLVGANGKILLGSGEGLEEGEEYDDVDFPALCQEFLDKPLELLVWNIKCQEKRLVTITPSDSWGGAGLLGVTIRLDDYGGAEERLIRVLDVEPSSPAAICGLKKESDYLLGTTADSFDSTTTLAQVLQKHLDKVVEVYVFNTDSDVVRVVALMPTYSWGGAGLLGAEVGTGYLHRLPVSSRGTIGTSVERKVRLVGMKPAHPAAEQQQQTSAAVLEVEPQLEMEVVESFDEAETRHKTVQQVADHGSGSNGGVAPPPPQAQVNEATTERNGDVAPSQAEMAKTEEPPRNEAEPLVETTTELAAPEHDADQASAAAEINGNVAPTSQEEATEAQTEEPHVETVITTESAAASEPSGEATRAEVPIPAAAPSLPTPEHQQEAEPSGQAAMMPPPPPPADAAALFAAPPPDASAAPSYASQYMPPPPMSRFSTNRQGEVDLR